MSELNGRNLHYEGDLLGSLIWQWLEKSLGFTEKVPINCTGVWLHYNQKFAKAFLKGGMAHDVGSFHYI